MKKTEASKTKKVNKISDASTKKNVKSKKNKVYFSFKSRLTMYIVCFVILYTVCLLFASKTIEREKIAPIRYNENGSISYKVYLNENSYYTENYLDMNRAYIANLIKYIDVDFNYLFEIDKSSNIDFEYKIIGKLIIDNSNGSKKYLEKDYVILDSKNASLDNSRVLNISENVKVDYSYYNSLANNFRAEYGVETNSYLVLNLEVTSKSDENLSYKINDKNNISLRIPLSERAIEINLDSSNQDVTKQVVPKENVIFNAIPLIVEIVSFILACLFLRKVIKYVSLLIKEKTPYDKYVNKLLKDYDRLIVETHTPLDMNDYKVIEVNSFIELLDVRDNLKLPIIYLNIVKHQKGIFYIKNNNDIYLVKIKNVDLLNKK